MIRYLILKLGDTVIGKYRFKGLGSKGHATAIKKAQDDFEFYLGEDLIDDFAQYLFLQ